MAKSNKYHYYVIVFADDGARYVTSTDNWERTARWDFDKKPKEMSKDDATYLAKGLTINGHYANCVVSDYELTHQPYRYEEYECKWEKKNDRTTD